MTSQSELRPPRPVPVRHRKLTFAFESQGFARYWHGGSALKTLFWTQLSTAFQDGERFLMRSARGLRAFADPELEAELAEFCLQESQHLAQHRKFDRCNAANGIDVEACRARYDAALEAATRQLDPIQRLAFTVAGEHLTAVLGELLLARPEFFAGADPNVKALWLWHAAEELEHKATCFDIYRAAGGSYFGRIRFMYVVWTFFVWTSLRNTAALLRADGQLCTADALHGLAYLLGPRGLVAGLARGLIPYLSPWFHPLHADHTGLVRAWQREYAHDERSLSPSSTAES